LNGENKDKIYDENDVNDWGESKYVRLKDKNNSIDTSLLVGNWIISHIDNGRKKEAYNGSWSFEIKLNKTGNYKIFWGSPRIETYGDGIYYQEKWNPYYYKLFKQRANWYIERIEPNTLILKAIRNNKIEIIYAERDDNDDNS